MGDSNRRVFLYLVGSFMIGLCIFEVTCAPMEKSEKEPGESSGTSSGENTNTYRIAEIFELAMKVLDENKNLLLKKKEIKELFGEDLKILTESEELNSDLRMYAGGQTAIRYYLRHFPDHAPLLDLAVEKWRKIVSDSFEKTQKTSKEIYESFMNAKPSPKSINAYTEIAEEIADAQDRKMSLVEKNYFAKGIFVELSGLFEILYNSNIEKEVFTKISSLYKKGIFDDICDSMQNEDLEFLFALSSQGIE
ncbi:uncharacterized protein LOC111050866 [Nilaparvata lugens]|uniref:uncharacterized protein LOC111050866 n=1 Tax=Nilaparvata lugens TaxID=108931 RepID=UPI00193DF403|nr:uncharacterized protein LOC111050866 [Nilaparvata lugens]